MNDFSYQTKHFPAVLFRFLLRREKFKRSAGEVIVSHIDGAKKIVIVIAVGTHAGYSGGIYRCFYLTRIAENLNFWSYRTTSHGRALGWRQLNVQVACSRGGGCEVKVAGAVDGRRPGPS